MQNINLKEPTSQISFEELLKILKREKRERSESRSDVNRVLTLRKDTRG